MLLGITVDGQMNWKQHVTDVVRATSYKLPYYILHIRALGTSAKVLCMMYYSIMYTAKSHVRLPSVVVLSDPYQQQLKGVQKRACWVTRGPAYNTYEDALTTLCLPITP